MNRSPLAPALAALLLLGGIAAAQPDPITNLNAVADGRGNATLTWSSPTNLPSSKWRSDCYYEIHFSTVDPAGNVDAWWDAAQVCPSHPVPANSGLLETLVVEGADPASSNWFVVRTFDGKYEEFSGNSNVASVAPLIPALPAVLAQLRRDGTVGIPFGGTTTQSSVVVSAKLIDPGLRPCRLEVEVKVGADPFDGQAVLSGVEVESGVTSTVRIDGLAPSSSFRWRARVVNSIALASAWVQAGGSDLGQVDFATAAAVAPSLSGSTLSQALDGAGVDVGTKVLGETMTFGAALGHVDGNGVRLEVEVRRLGESFTGQPTITGAAVPSGGIATVAGDVSPGRYQWQARGVEMEWATAGPWISFGGNSEGELDFELQSVGSVGTASACSASGVAGAGCLLLLLALVATVRA